MNKYAIQLKNISKAYQDGEQNKIVLNNISLDVRPGEFVAIVGPSGSGKSTLLSIAGALLSADKGDIIIGNQTILEKKQWNEFRRRRVGFIFQNHQLLPYLKVYDQLFLNTKKTSEKKTLAEEILNELELIDMKKRYPEGLSGGEKQRVAIARAFMNEPDVILADEPTASLDKIRGRAVIELIAKEVKKRKKAAIMVTHDERILDLVDTIYQLEDGVLIKIMK
ncbi:ABC transporter related protein [Ruminiclostridium papyrosolvens DSM 2782]|uniref:ABC transporter related protein n=1 Tax=Ruminiclostridium papyrosolvens DSM 2782 TaxID=588581 RepID=F1TBQ8_9FIRM|nr:ABC transporter ATP-binding protein [Ruminiclostridium papyrosolvens]EGD48079.1 ABC transporter related protein [Ruminiclostridium papyrosolvens DSM 2782]WES35037.1 ABC transporter ATP-binding protein [Ruminiclostridium papyrosolvens DSM 2782]